ncbi:major facilitator superfamily domain-containing protein [Cadophora sp. MPI-SDFR-AT-0126]|nr:major facilitator superfamily domain-containing protein [Leotiomycetes sp. MPI-SDFR-AT-0126]
MAPHSDEDSLDKENAPAPTPELERGTVKPEGPISPARDEDTTLAILDLVKAKDVHHPMHWPAWKRWGIIALYCWLQVFVTLTSTTYLGAEWLIQEKWGGSTQVVTLGQSLFIVGNAVGPAFMGPLSDIGGRKWVYVGSITCYAILNFGTAYARNLPMLIIFMFLCGTAGSTALSNVAGTIADLFGDVDGAGQAMALFVVSANVGPSVGSPVGGWITDNTSLGLKWIFLINVIIGFGFAVIMCFIPETLPRLVIARAAAKAQDVDADEQAILTSKVNVWKEFRFVTTMTFRIMLSEPIVLCLGIYNGFAYGILFLYLDGVFDVFVLNNGLSIISADLTYLNFVVGVLVMFCFIPVQTWFYARDRKKHGTNRPEARFLVSLVTVWLFPITLLWFAFTSDGKTSYWSPIVAGAVLGFADPLLWLSMLNYITDSYPNVAGSAIAAFLIPSFLMAAGLAHLGVLMFENMSTKWAVATIGFISFGLCALIYFVYFFGAKIRMRSKLARTF